MNNIIDISSYTPAESDIFLMDCNVLMYLNYPNGSYELDTVNKYSSFFSLALQKNAKFVLTDVLLSEFVNTYSRLEYKKYCSTNNISIRNFNFKKDYKPTQAYFDLIEEIEDVINTDIFTTHDKLDINFSKICINDIFANKNTFDFNDVYYMKIAEEYNLKIITHDADFSTSNKVSILTANRNLLAKSS